MWLVNENSKYKAMNVTCTGLTTRLGFCANGVCRNIQSVNVCNYINGMRRLFCVAWNSMSTFLPPGCSDSVLLSVSDC
jgi:hypothetical protein